MMKTNEPQRESLKMSRDDWPALTKLAADTGSLYSGAPSWRRMILRIARGEITLRVRQRRANIRDEPRSPEKPLSPER